MDISPLRILNNCGNSSILNFLNHLPTLVICFFGFKSLAVGTFLGVFTCIVRNLYIVKVFLWIPIRSCLKNTGPLESNFMHKATKRNKGDKTIRIIKDEIKSIILFA